MGETVAQMTREELIELIEASIERKLLEILGDPDEGLDIREEVKARLLRQRKAVAAGERGRSLEEVPGDSSRGLQVAKPPFGGFPSTARAGKAREGGLCYP